MRQGAKANGKTNHGKALQYKRSVATGSVTAIQPSQTFAFQPFRLDADFATQPSKFQVTFLLDGTRHQYGFATTTWRMLHEHLQVYRTGL